MIVFQIDQRLSRSLFIWILWLNLLCTSYCCGPGGTTAGNAFSTNDNANQQQESLTDVSSWLPSTRGLANGAILNYLNSNLQKSFGNVKSEIYEPVTGSPIRASCPSDLDCSFDDDRRCRWRSSKEADLDFYLTRGKPDTDKWEIYVGTREKPKEPFLTSAGNKGDHRALFVSEQIHNQSSDAVLKFKYWTTPLIELRVCTQNPDAKTFNFCSETVEREKAPGPAIVLIPGPIREPFEIVIEVKNFITDPGGVAFIDDIEYISSACAKENLVSTREPIKKSSQSASSDQTKQLLIPSEVCDAIPCIFDGSNCGYVLKSPLGTSGWRIENGPVGNRATGIQKDVNGVENFQNSYILASGRKGGLTDLFVAESRAFFLTENINVRFFKHIMSTPAELKVCLVNFSYCPKTYQVNINEQGWHEASVLFRADSVPIEFQNKPVKLLFVVENLKQNNYVGIDNIRVFSDNNQQSLC